MKNMKILLLVGIAWIVACVPGFAADKGVATPTAKSTESAKVPLAPRMLNLDGNEVDVNRLEKEGSYRLNPVTRRQKLRNGKEEDIKFNRRAEYFRKSKRIAYIESANYSDATLGHLQVYNEKGVKVFEKKLEPKKGIYRNFQAVQAIGPRYIATFTQDIYTEPRQHLDVYNVDADTVVFSTICSYASRIEVSPSEDYFLFTVKEPGKTYAEIYKYDFETLKKIIGGDGLFLAAFSNDGRSYLIGKTRTVGAGTTEYPHHVDSFSFFTSDLLKSSADTVEFEFPKKTLYSINGRYVIFFAETDAVKRGNKILRTPIYSIFDAITAKTLAEGKLSPDTVEKYVNETVVGGRR